MHIYICVFIYIPNNNLLSLNNVVHIHVLGWQVGIAYPLGVFLHREDYFSCLQGSLVACSSLRRNEVLLINLSRSIVDVFGWLIDSFLQCWNYTPDKCSITDLHSKLRIRRDSLLHVMRFFSQDTLNESYTPREWRDGPVVKSPRLLFQRTGIWFSAPTWQFIHK